jgi:hypothetical protein
MLSNMKFKYSTVETVPRDKDLGRLGWAGNNSRHTSYKSNVKRGRVSTLEKQLIRSLLDGLTLAPSLQKNNITKNANKNQCLHIHLLTPLRTVLLKKLTAAELVKKFPAFRVTRFQEQTNGPYPEPDRSSPCPHIPLPKHPPYYCPPIHITVPVPVAERSKT